MGENEDWNDSKRIAKGILQDRAARRRWLGIFLIVSLGMTVVGLWVLDVRLATEPLVFLLWWFGCAALTLFTLLLGVYDALQVMGEEKANATAGCCDRPEV